MRSAECGIKEIKIHHTFHIKHNTIKKEGGEMKQKKSEEDFSACTCALGVRGNKLSKIKFLKKMKTKIKFALLSLVAIAGVSVFLAFTPVNSSKILNLLCIHFRAILVIDHMDGTTTIERAIVYLCCCGKNSNQKIISVDKPGPGQEVHIEISFISGQDKALTLQSDAISDPIDELDGHKLHLKAGRYPYNPALGVYEGVATVE